jgi:hypothetical protein
MENISMRTTCSSIICVLFLLAVLPGLLFAQQGQKPATQKEQQPAAPIARLTVEITGGDENKPVENASVYLKTIEQHAIKDKKLEVNVKTNQLGIAHVPEAPLGRVLIQVVADGWKTYGHWYDITDPKQVIKIHLDRPPKWY